MINRAVAIAKRVYEQELASNGILCELRKRLQGIPDRDDDDEETDDAIAEAYGRKDPVNEEPFDWEDSTIFDFDEESPVYVRIWKQAKSRTADLYTILQKVDDRPEVTASLDSALEEGDVLINTFGVFEVVSVNRPSGAVCLELELIHRG